MAIKCFVASRSSYTRYIVQGLYVCPIDSVGSNVQLILTEIISHALHQIRCIIRKDYLVNFEERFFRRHTHQMSQAYIVRPLVAHHRFVKNARGLELLDYGNQ